MPGKDELRAMLLATLQAPAQQLVAAAPGAGPELRLRARRAQARSSKATEAAASTDKQLSASFDGSSRVDYGDGSMASMTQEQMVD